MSAASMESDSASGRWICKALVYLGLALPALALAHAGEAQDAATGAAAAPPHHATRRSVGAEGSIDALSKALDLDAEQQARLRQVLLDQRAQVQRVWADNSVPAAYRVVATQAISDQTADRIRALLNDEQKAKYKPPRPQNSAVAGSGPNVEDWMKKMRPQ